MKNKLYYILAVLYVLMFGFILYINGIFTGETVSMSNLWINVGFLLIIGILFLISFSGFSRLNRVTDALTFAAQEMKSKHELSRKNLWTEYAEKRDIFPSPILNE